MREHTKRESSGSGKRKRDTCRKLFCHDWVSVPLVYSQVTAIATYGYFTFALFGRQNLGYGG